MKGVHRSAIAFIPIAAFSPVLWTPITQAAPRHSLVQVESTAAPVSPLPASALEAGTPIPVILPGGNPDANLVMTVGESFETSFEVAEHVLDAQDNIIIPKGSEIAGIFEPETIRQREGVRFKARRITINSQPYDLQATSNPFLAKRRNQITANDIRSSVSTIAAATVVDSLFNRVGRAAGVDRRIIRGAKRGAGVGVLPTVLKTGQKLTQKANSSDEVIVVQPNQLGLTLDTGFQTPTTSTANQPATQSLSESSTTLARGTKLALRTTPPGTRYIVDAEESFPIRLRVTNDIYNRHNTRVIPKGSLVTGNLTPTSSGSVFKASQILVGDRTYPLNAQTAVIAPTDVSSLSPSNIQGSIVTSPKASSSLSKVRSGGNRSGGGILGQLLGTGNQDRVILFDPAATSLELTSDLLLGNQS